MPQKLKASLNREPTLEGDIRGDRDSLRRYNSYYGEPMKVESIYKTVYQKDGNEVCLIDKLEGKDNYSESVIDNIVVRELIASLSEREQSIIRMRYYEDYTQTQVADILGISQVQVSRLEKKILEKMRKILCNTYKNG